MMRSLRFQLGYLYLTTGGNGAGKTLMTIWDVRQLQVKTGRPVFFWGFAAKQPLLDFGWKEFEPSEWETLPDGSICIVDECQKVMPTRATGQPPAWIGALAQDNRKRGFDFFFITQHPLNIDSFVRRLIAAPAWHRHFKASMLGDASNELKWSAVNDQPQKDGSGKNGEVTSRKWPREAFDWYTSTSMDTRKTGIPLKVWKGVGALVLALGCVGFVGHQLYSMTMKGGGSGVASSLPSVPSATKPAMQATGPSGRNSAEPASVDEYLAARTPRLKDFPHTAPAYDQVTAPSVAPYPAACVHMGARCECYTQQATLMQVSMQTCLQVVKRGFFMDWKSSPPADTQQPRNPPQMAQQVAQAEPVRTVPVPMPAAPPEPPQSQYLQGLAARNAQVRSSLIQ